MSDLILRPFDMLNAKQQIYSMYRLVFILKWFPLDFLFIGLPTTCWWFSDG